MEHFSPGAHCDRPGAAQAVPGDGVCADTLNPRLSAAGPEVAQSAVTNRRGIDRAGAK